MQPVRLSILIPVYNQAPSITAVLDRVAIASLDYLESERVSAELIVVDDGSQDDSAEIVRRFSLIHPRPATKLIRHRVHSGIGAAIRTALAHAEGDFCLVQPASFQCNPADYPKLLAPLLSDEADVVLARTTDPRGAETAVKAFRTSLARTVPLRRDGPGFNSEILIQFAKRHARFSKVPLSCEGRKIEAPSTLSTLCTILRTRFISRSHTDPAADMLVAMSRAERFNRWMADTIAPWVRGEVLELGAGIGNLTLLLAPRAVHYEATDTDAEHLFELRSRIPSGSNICYSFCDFTAASEMARYRDSIDTVVCLNSLEHVDDDLGALRNVRQCLRPGGVAVILVPQGPQVFGSMDEVLHHKRRYTQEELRRKMREAGFAVREIREFNRATWPGWYLNSRLLRKRTLSRTQLRIFDLLVPVWRRLDPVFPWPATSLIAVGSAAGAE